LPRPPKHRKPIIDASVTLFRRHGYGATGLNDIVEWSGAPKGSLYHYFPGGKPSIAVAAVEEAGRRVVATLETLAAETTSTGELLCAHARLLSRWMAKSGFRDGCPMTTVLLELTPADRSVNEAGRSAYDARIRILTQKLRADGFDDARATRLASLCTAALQGALIEARVRRTGKPLMIAAEELSRMLEESLRPRAPS